MLFKRDAARTAATSTRRRRRAASDDKYVLVLEDGAIEVGPGRERLPVVPGQPVWHLLVEDDVSDPVLLKQAFRALSCRVVHHPHHVLERFGACGRQVPRAL